MRDVSMQQLAVCNWQLSATGCSKVQGASGGLELCCKVFLGPKKNNKALWQINTREPY